MAEFHFLRPWWFVLLPVGIWLIFTLLRGRGGAGGWRGVVDLDLRAHVLAEPEVLRESRWPLLAALAAWTLGIIALAGPAWERLPVPAFRSEEALVVALDLSRSMDAPDVEPSRLARAKLKLRDLLERRAAGQTALIVFSTHAFTVTPLTTDTRTIESLVGSVTTEIMPTQGGSIEAALLKGAGLLKQTGLNEGDILLITDSEVANADLETAEDLRREGFRVSVLAVGTEQGAPISRPEGGFMTDAAGNVVVPQLDPRGLQRLAAAGGGRFARLAPDDRDLDALFPSESVAAGAALASEDGGESYEADVWRDRGAWLAVLLLPLLALGFRRGWISVLALWLVLPAPQAQAFEWADLWKRPDQRGYEAMQAENAAQAAELFEDPAWRGAAEYRAGNFADSAATLGGVDTADGQYNRGNALAKSGELEAAISAYDRALTLDPDHADARYNRDLVQDLLDQQREEQQQQQQSENGEQSDQGEQQSGSSDTEQSEQANADQSEQGDPSEEGEQSDQAQAQSGDSEGTEEPGDEGEQPGEQQAQNESEAEQSDAEGTPAPQDVEQWASEQAAEQWLRRIPQDPGGLLRRKFLYQYQRLGVDQDGRPVREGDAKPW
jgi:Ca-activated chloride channel family protein